MKNELLPASGDKRIISRMRKAIVISNDDLVKTGFLDEQTSMPLVIEPAENNLSLPVWAKSNSEYLQSKLLEHGAILFRSFDMTDANDLQRLIQSVSGEPLEYLERSSPRHQVADKIYTSTDYPPDQSIFLHNENSYQHRWPLKIFFMCITPALQGGETPIADVRRVFRRIDSEVRNRFKNKGVMYVRKYSNGLGLPWQTVFQTSDKAAVNDYCARSGILTEWEDEDQLRTRQVSRAVIDHPVTKEPLWFNHAAFFHVSTLDPVISEVLLSSFGEDNLPSNTYYGDGSRIEPETLAQIKEAYRQETVAFPWRKGDVLMLDNMLVAHGRAPYSGDREVIVGMAEQMSDPGF
jgi:alpha-ketoglutarate-dependent taurine dioxygenase